MRLPHLLALAALAPPVGAQWSQWGGPTRDFVSPETGLLDRWPEGGPEELWSTSIPGRYAGLVVHDGRLVSAFARTEGEELVAALDALDGTILWETANPQRPPGEEVMLNFGRGPNATPLVHDGRVFSVGFSGFLQALDLDTGERLWSHDLYADLGAKEHTFGYSISPLRVDDTLIVGVGSAEIGLAAFDLEDGTLAWKSDPVDVSYTSPLPIRVDGREELVLMASTEVVGLDPRTGEVLWRHPHRNLNDNNCWQPVWSPEHGLLTISSHSDGYTQGLRLAHDEGRATVEEVWTNRKVNYFHSTSVRLVDVIVGSDGTDPPTFLTALDLVTGERLWKERGFSKASCLLVEGRLLLVTDAGEVVLADADRSGLRVRSRFHPLRETAWAAPTVADGILYLRDPYRVRAFDLRAD